MAAELSVDTIVAALPGLDDEDLETIGEACAAVMAARKRKAEAAELAPGGGEMSQGKGGPSAYIEYKTINGCGPYAYLRWRSGKVHHSKYMGKAQKAGGK